MSPDVLLSARGLTKTFGDFTAVDGVDFEVRPGEAFGFLGPNGAGKSSTMRMVAAVSPVTSGELRIFGLDPAVDGPAIRARLGNCPQQDRLDEELSVEENLWVYGRFFGLSKAEVRARADELLDFAQLTERRHDKVEPLSGGMKRRLVIARSLINNPELLLLDEPTNGLDPAGIVEIRTLLMDLGRNGRTVVVSSHLMAEIEAACDYIVIIRFGELLFAGPTGELLAQTSAHIDVRPERHDELGPLLDALRAQNWRGERMGDVLRIHAEPGRAGDLNRAAAAAGFTLGHLVVGQDSLEDIFLEITGHSDGELAAGRAAAATSTRREVA